MRKIEVVKEGKNLIEVEREALDELRGKVLKEHPKITEEELIFATDKFVYHDNEEYIVKLVFRPSKLRALTYKRFPRKEYVIDLSKLPKIDEEAPDIVTIEARSEEELEMKIMENVAFWDLPIAIYALEEKEGKLKARLVVAPVLNYTVRGGRAIINIMNLFSEKDPAEIKIVKKVDRDYVIIMKDKEINIEREKK